jgi:Na+-transporting methylmalonyl-CoA/oxaloacetate decarboxylase gamma subunit
MGFGMSLLQCTISSSAVPPSDWVYGRLYQPIWSSFSQSTYFVFLFLRLIAVIACLLASFVRRRPGFQGALKENETESDVQVHQADSQEVRWVGIFKAFLNKESSKAPPGAVEKIVAKHFLQSKLRKKNSSLLVFEVHLPWCLRTKVRLCLRCVGC